MSVPPAPRPRRGEAAFLAAVAATVLVALALVELRSPAFFLWDDNATAFLPYYAHDWRGLVTGRLAHLDFHQYLGQIHLGNGQSGALYPPVYAAAALATLLWGDLRPTIDVLAALHLAAAAVGMALLLRRWGAGRGVAFLAALLWPATPFVLQVSRSWIPVALVAALLPFHVLALDRLLARPTGGAVLALAAVKALVVLQGYVQYAALLGLLDVAWVTARIALDPALRRGAGRRVAAWLAAHAASAVLAAPLLLPMLEARGLSAYRAAPLSPAEFHANALAWGDFLGAQVYRMRPRAVHLAASSIFHVGLPLLGLAAAAALPAVRRGDRRPAAALATAAAALVLAGPGADLLYRLPLYASFRWPFKSFLFVAFYALVAAAGSAAAIDARPAARRSWGRLALAAGLASCVAVAAVPRWNVPFGPYRLERSVDELRAAVRAMLDPAAGRVVSLWQPFLQPDTERHLTFHFATLAGARHLGGYDPLIARGHLELALGLEYSNIYRGRVDARVLAHLDRWGVRWLVLPPGPLEARLAGWPGLRPHHRDAAVAVWENTRAWPLVAFEETPRRGLTTDWDVDRFVVELGGAGAGGALRVAVAPLRWYRWWADGRAMGPVDWGDDGRMRLAVPPGTRRVEVRYVGVPFRLGAAAAALLLLAWALAAARRRARAARDQSGSQGKAAVSWTGAKGTPSGLG